MALKGLDTNILKILKDSGRWKTMSEIREELVKTRGEGAERLTREIRESLTLLVRTKGAERRLRDDPPETLREFGGRRRSEWRITDVGRRVALIMEKRGTKNCEANQVHS